MKRTETEKEKKKVIKIVKQNKEVDR